MYIVFFILIVKGLIVKLKGFGLSLINYINLVFIVVM